MKTKLSNLSFIPKFDSTTGWDGYENWKDDVHANINKFFKTENEATFHFIMGLNYGYPDQALLDMYEVLNNDNDSEKTHLAFSKIPYSDYYDCAQPNFQYFPAHEEEDSIKTVRNSWGQILRTFYNSQWHKSILQNPDFIKIRNFEEKNHRLWIEKYRNMKEELRNSAEK